MLKYFLLSMVFVLLFASCTKKADGGSEESLHGVWAKGPNAGDTLRFFRKNGRHIMAYSMSFNPSMQAPTESEYFLRGDELRIQLFGTGDLIPVGSFKWLQRGSRFEVQGIQFFPFMSSTIAYFTYQKVQ